MMADGWLLIAPEADRRQRCRHINKSLASDYALCAIGQTCLSLEFISGILNEYLYVLILYHLFIYLFHFFLLLLVLMFTADGPRVCRRDSRQNKEAVSISLLLLLFIFII